MPFNSAINEPKFTETALLVNDSTPRIHSEASKDHCTYTAIVAEGVQRAVPKPSTPPIFDRLQCKYLCMVYKAGNEAMHAAIAHYYARYLGLGTRYETGICTIVISMNGAFHSAVG